MSTEPAFKRLFWTAALALHVCAALVVVCYFFVDRPVAVFVHGQGFSLIPALKWLTYPPPIVQAWVPAVLAALMIRRVRGQFRAWEQALLAAGVGMILADQFRESLSYVFGRYWPETWIDHNPSFIHDGAYGFHPFHGGSWYGSFPSGHSARTVAVAAAVWILAPKWRWACVVAVALESIGLIGMNYHFVGDVVAGGFVGGIVGMYSAHCCREEV